MIGKVFGLIIFSGLLCNTWATLARDIQNKSNGGCIYEGRLLQAYSEFVPVYNPRDNFGCVRVLCKNLNPTQLEMHVHSCGVMVDSYGRRAELWPGRMYPDCCRKLN